MILARFEEAFPPEYKPGLELGRRLGMMALLVPLLDQRFGLLPDESIDKLRKMPSRQLLDLGIQLNQANSLAELGL